MSVTFVIETGTASASSTTYATVAQYKQYMEDRGLTADSAADAVIQGALNMATEYLDSSYRFMGWPVSSAQALEWPRVGTFNRYGVEINSTSIPAEIVDATIYLATQQRGAQLNQASENIRSESYGPVSKSYAGAGNQKSFPYVDKILKYFLKAGNAMQRVN